MLEIAATADGAGSEAEAAGAATATVAKMPLTFAC